MQGLRQPKQQQGGKGQGCHNQNHPEKPPGLEVAVHDRCEALQIVITKKAIPKRLAFDQQFCDVPREADQRRDREGGRLLLSVWDRGAPSL